MKLEVGKTYLDREGIEVTVELNENSGSGYKFKGGREVYQENGKWYDDFETDKRDLISEVVKETKQTNIMNKSDLKTGMRCERRNGDIRFIFVKENGNVIVTDEDGYHTTDYNEDLTSIYGSGDDMVKVFGFPSDHEFFNIKHKGELLWERNDVVELTVEQICEKLGMNVKIVK